MESQFKLLERPKSGAPPLLEDFTLKYLAKGTFGKVYQAVHRSTNKLYALKEISKFNDKTAKKSVRELDYINQELSIMYALDSEFIVRLYDHFETTAAIYLVLELVEGVTHGLWQVELYSGVILRRMALNDKVCARIIYQLCQALKHMHSRGIIHRDIKPENILLTKQLNIKLIDFGTANYCGPLHYRATKIGSLPYFAPEIVQKRSHDQAVDVWCVGILLYELHTFRTPFEHQSNTELNILTNRIEYPSSMEPDLRDLISKILIKDAKGRLTMDQIIEHVWIRKNVPKATSNQSKVDKQPPTNPPAAKLNQQPPATAQAVTPKLQLRKNALITEQTKPKDWSSSGKFLLKKPAVQTDHSANKSKGKSVGKRVSPTRLLEAQVKSLQKEMQSLEDAYQKTIKKAKVTEEKKIRDFELKLEKVMKEANKRRTIISSNSAKLLTLRKEIEASAAFQQENEAIKESIAQAEQTLERLKEEKDLLVLKEQSLAMELKQVKKLLSSGSTVKFAHTPTATSNLNNGSARDSSKSSQRLKSSSKLVPALKLKPTTAGHNRTISHFETNKDTVRTQGSITVGEIDSYIEQMREKRKHPGSLTTTDKVRHS